MFGLKEEEGEEVISETIGEVFEALGEKPRPESVLRLGTKQKEQIRPVLIKFRTAAAAYGVLKKSQGLRKNDKFMRVYISADREAGACKSDEAASCTEQEPAVFHPG